MDLEKVKEAQSKAVADAIASGLSEEKATEIFGGVISTVETEAGKTQSKLDDFDKVVGQRDALKESAKQGEEAIAKLKAMELEGKSETEKLQALVEELQPHKATAEALTPIAEEMVTTITKDFPESLKKIVEAEESLAKRLALARSLSEGIGTPGPGPGPELPGQFSGETITRAAYDKLGTDDDLNTWFEVRKKVSAGKMKIID